MNDLEMEIGRTLGASCFFVYQTIKANPNFTKLDVQIETGLSHNATFTALEKLRHSNVINREEKNGAANLTYIYKENKAKETWKFH